MACHFQRIDCSTRRLVLIDECSQLVQRLVFDGFAFLSM